MTLGTSIFLSTLMLSVVILFVVTKDRWNWKRIVRWAFVLPLGLAVIAAAGVYMYLHLQDQPKVQDDFFGIQLQATVADVKFTKGEPSAKDGEDRWIYNVGFSSDDEKDAQYLVQFKNGRVRFVIYSAEPSIIVNPYLLGFTIGSHYQEVQKKLGAPSHTATSADDLDRMLSYDRFNSFFSFRQSKLAAYGVFDPQEGPMRFRSEKSEPKSEK
jgi:hypothetical protein